jgi:hypothetical protein
MSHDKRDVLIDKSIQQNWFVEIFGYSSIGWCHKQFIEHHNKTFLKMSR